MKSVWYEELGPADDVLVVGDMDAPEAGPGEVRVKLSASGVNPADAKRRGLGTYGLEHPRIIPNSDGAGIVDQVGEGADPGLLGQRVWLFNGQRGGRAFGTAAEYIALDAWLVAPLPDHLSFAEGACLGIPCMTAHRNVFADGPVTGKTLLINGGAGAVGHYAVQWARRGGARVIATVSSDEKAAHAVAGGAVHIVNYRDDDAATQIMDLTEGAGVDRIIEVEGEPDDINGFLDRLRGEPPPLAVIDAVEVRDIPAVGGTGFRIEDTSRSDGGRTLVSPDVAMCADCEAEQHDPADRRYRHAFVNCTNCGPRFTIIAAVPYDRATTTMAAFPMCADCAAEYADPADRRFHAQPVCCPHCGPTLSYLDAQGRRLWAALPVRAPPEQVREVGGPGL